MTGPALGTCMRHGVFAGRGMSTDIDTTTDSHQPDEIPGIADARASKSTPEMLARLPEQHSMDRVLETLLTHRLHFFHNKEIPENERVSQLFSDAINVVPGLQYHVRRRLVRFSGLKYQESPKARRRLRRDLDHMLESNVACSENVIALAKRYWDSPMTQISSSDGDCIEANEWDPDTDPVASRNLLSLSTIWDPELKALYRVTRTFFHDHWLQSTDDVASSQTYVVDIAREDEEQLILATVQCHKQLTAVLGRRKQSSLYALLTRLFNRHVSASTREKPRKRQKRKGRQSAPKFVSASEVLAEVASQLQKQPRALAFLTSLFEGELRTTDLNQLSVNAVALANVKAHFQEVEHQPESEHPPAPEDAADDDEEHQRVTFVSDDVVRELRKERREVQPFTHPVDDSSAALTDGVSGAVGERAVWHLRSHSRGFAEAEFGRADDFGLGAVPDNGGAVVFSNMHPSWTLESMNDVLGDCIGEVVDMKLLPRSAFGVPLHLLFSHESSSNGLAAASIDVVLREDGRVAAGRGLITDLMPTTTDEKHVLGVLQFGSDEAYNRAMSAHIRSFGVHIQGRLCRTIASAEVPVCLKLNNAQIFRNVDNLEAFLNVHLPETLKVLTVKKKKVFWDFSEFLHHSMGEHEDTHAVIQYSNYVQALAAKTCLSHVAIQGRPMQVSWVFPGDDRMSPLW